MKNIANFFDSFKNKAILEIKRRDIVKEIIKNYIKIDLNIKDIKISNNIIYIKASNIIKNEIIIKKVSIIENINKNTDLNIKDIR